MFLNSENNLGWKKLLEIIRSKSLFKAEPNSELDLTSKSDPTTQGPISRHV